MDAGSNKILMSLGNDECWLHEQDHDQEEENNFQDRQAEVKVISGVESCVDRQKSITFNR